MPHLRFLPYFLASLLNIAVLAIPSDSNSPPTIHGHHDSREKENLANSIFVNDSLTNTANLSLPASSFSEYNTSTYGEPTVFCHVNPPFPLPPVYGHVDIVECGLLIITMLADDSTNLQFSRWSPTSPLVLPWTWGISPNCNIRIEALRPWSSDVFQQAMIAQRAALIVQRCTDNRGGIVSLGPREQFQVQMYGVGEPGRNII